MVNIKNTILKERVSFLISKLPNNESLNLQSMESTLLQTAACKNNRSVIALQTNNQTKTPQLFNNFPPTCHARVYCACVQRLTTDSHWWSSKAVLS